VDVFSAFPHAIVYGQWLIGSVERATEVGNVFKPIGYLDVIIEEGCSTQTGMTPNADQIDSDSLLYTKPEQLPTCRRAGLMAGFMLLDTEDGQFYEIRDVAVGKNQETGETEHLELKIRQTEAEYEVDS